MGLGGSRSQSRYNGQEKNPYSYRDSNHAVLPTASRLLTHSFGRGNDENRKTVTDLSNMPLEDAAYSILNKGMNSAVTLAVVPTEDILCGVAKAIGVLPEETAEEVGQETIRILKGSCKPKDNLSGAERKSLQTSEELTALPAGTELRPWY
jgi:hypothetical protein